MTEQRPPEASGPAEEGAPAPGRSGRPGRPRRASREMRRSRTIRRLRWLVLLATVGAIAAVVAVLVSGRADRPGGSASDLEDESLEPTGELVTVGEGFERTVSEGEERLFTVRGDRYSLDKKGIIYLDGVEVVIYREEGAEYRVEARQGRFDIEQRQGRLAGGVRVTAPDGLSLETRNLRITHQGRQIRTTSKVRFELGDGYRGRADGLHAWLPARRYLLQGLVRIDSLPEAEQPLQIEAKGLVIDRGRKLLRSREWAVLRRRGERLSALEMHVFLADDEKTVRFVRAERRVTGIVRSGGALDLAASGSRRIGFEAGKMTLMMSRDGRHPKELDLESGAGTRARVHTLGPPSAPRYRITAATIEARFSADGEAERAEAEGGVVLVMHEPGERSVDEASLGAPPTDEDEGGSREGGEEGRAGPRQASSRRAVALFDGDGEVATVELLGGVRIVDPQAVAEGERALLRVAQDDVTIEGRPAVTTSSQGVVEAPSILYTRSAGLVHGTGGVRARLDDAQGSALGGLPLASGPRGEGPVRVEAEQGYFRDDPRSFLFVGKVRAWRGDDLLVADELRGDQAEDRLIATGSVRTLWHPEPGAAGARGGGDGPIEITAGELLYRQRERLLIYTESVRAEQAGRTITGREIRLTLAEGGGVERMVATGDVVVEAPPGEGEPRESRKRLEGARAVYEPGARTITVTAEPGGKVRLREGGGNAVEGPRMEFDIDADRVRVLGREEAPPPSESP